MIIKVPHKLVKARLIGLLWVMFFAFLFSWAGYYVIFKAIYNLKPYQKLTFFVESYSVLPNKPEQFQKLLDNEELKEKGLENIIYYSYDIFGEETPSAKTIIKYLDYAILPEASMLAYTGKKDDFRKIDELITLPSQLETAYDGYAIKIYDPSNPTYNEALNFSSWISFSKDQYTASFYLVVSSFSQNFDEENNHVLGYASLNMFLANNLK